MGSWFTAERDGKCQHCRKAIAIGADAYQKSRGVTLCNACGLVADATSEVAASITAAVQADLATLPEEARISSFATAALYMAGQLDAGDVSPREVTNYTKEIRLSIMQLRDMYPPAGEEDATSRADAARQRRLREIGGM